MVLIFAVVKFISCLQRTPTAQALLRTSSGCRGVSTGHRVLQRMHASRSTHLPRERQNYQRLSCHQTAAIGQYRGKGKARYYPRKYTPGGGVILPRSHSGGAGDEDIVPPGASLCRWSTGGSGVIPMQAHEQDNAVLCSVTHHKRRHVTRATFG